MRADKYFSGKFGSRTKAKEALDAGRVLLLGKPVCPSDEIRGGETFVFLDGDDFVSNGGRKLERGLDAFHADVAGKVFADLGASTGGFTDCLLRRGAKTVYCVDVGESLLDGRIAADPRVVVMDRTNARYLTRESFKELPDGVVSDLSFISLRLVLPAVRDILREGGEAFVLFKPQFECGGRGLGKSGILPVRCHRALLADFYDFCTALGLAPLGVVNAPVYPKKNVEYIVWLKRGEVPPSKEHFLQGFENFLKTYQKI